MCVYIYIYMYIYIHKHVSHQVLVCPLVEAAHLRIGHISSEEEFYTSPFGGAKSSCEELISLSKYTYIHIHISHQVLVRPLVEVGRLRIGYPTPSLSIDINESIHTCIHMCVCQPRPSLSRKVSVCVCCCGFRGACALAWQDLSFVHIYTYISS